MPGFELWGALLMNPQPGLSPRSAAEVPELTEAMRLALQWIDWLEGRPLCEHLHFRRMDQAERRSISAPVLRKLIRLGLVEVMGLAPGRYRVTKLGKVARSLGVRS